MSEEKGAFGALARVKPPGEPFQIVYSHRHYRPNQQGITVLTIEWVNSANGKAVVRNVGEETVVCSADTHPQQHFTCGIRVMDASLRWAAVFDRDQVGNAAAIRAKTVAYLEKYRLAAVGQRKES